MKTEKHFDSEDVVHVVTFLALLLPNRGWPGDQRWLDKTAQKEKSCDNPLCRAIC